MRLTIPSIHNASRCPRMAVRVPSVIEVIIVIGATRR